MSFIFKACIKLVNVDSVANICILVECHTHFGVCSVVMR